MQFSYRGFQQQQGKRRFTILGTGKEKPTLDFHFTVDLVLLTQHGVGLQEVPSLCFNLLTSACSEEESTIHRFSEYEIGSTDLIAFTAPRRAVAAARANKQPYHPNRRAQAAGAQSSDGSEPNSSMPAFSELNAAPVGTE